MQQFADWLQNDRRTAIKIWELVTEISRTPFHGKGKPEQLRGNLKGCWSRRIDDSNRLVYQLDDNVIILLACKGHYDD